MAIPVYVELFGPGPNLSARVAAIPDLTWRSCEDIHDELHCIFKYSQNEVQDRKTRSSMAGDVIHLRGKKYLILDEGFRVLNEKEFCGYLIKYMRSL